MTSVSLIFVEWVPDLFSTTSLFFIIAFVCSLGLWVFDKLISRKILLIEVVIVCFLMYVLSNLVVAIAGGIEMSDWVRSAMPVLVFGYSLFLFEFFKRSNIFYASWVLIVCAVIWSLFLIFKNDINFLNLLINFSRITGIEQGFVVPYPFLGAILLMTIFRHGFLTVTLLLYFFLLVIVTGYKSQLALLAVAMVFYIYRSRLSLTGLCKAIFGSLTSILLLILFDAEFSVSQYIATRFSSIGGAGDAIRVFEIVSAIDIFSDSPLLGNGFGVDFPTAPDSLETKNYIHNFFFYYLATVGLVGLLFMLVLLFVSVKPPKGFDFYVSGSLVAFTLLLFTAVTAASFKLVHFNYFLAVLFVAIHSSSSVGVDKSNV